jgi:hypothetical protein
MQIDKEFTGESLRRLVVDIQAAVGRNVAGLTPLGSKVIRLAQEAYDNDPEAKRITAEEMKQFRATH